MMPMALKACACACRGENSPLRFTAAHAKRVASAET